MDERPITYCDIYKCDECPRCGDDCDGKFDEFLLLTKEEYEELTPLQKYWYDKGIEDQLKALEVFADLEKAKAKGDDTPVKIRKFSPLRFKREEEA